MKRLIIGLLAGMFLGGASYTFAATVLFPYQGGTGISAPSSADVGKCLTLGSWTSASNWAYNFATCGGGGGGSGGAWATTTQNILTYLSSQWSAVVGGTATTSDARFSVFGSSTVSGTGMFGGELRVPNIVATSSATSTFPVMYSSTSTVSNLNGVVYVDGVRFARNSTGINQAITECSRLYPTGCVVQLPMGTTTMSANTPIAPVSNVWVRGYGKGRTILVPDPAATGGNGDAIRLITASEPYYENVHLSDFTINATGQYSGSATGTNAATYSNAITLQGVDNLQINGVEIIRPFGFGIDIGSSGGTTRYVRNPQIWDVSIVGERNGNDSIGGGGIDGGFIQNYSFIDGYGTVSDLTNLSNFQYNGIYATRTATGIYSQNMGWGMGVDFGATNVTYNNINIDGAYFGLVVDQSASFGSSTDIKITNSTFKNLWKSAIYMPSVSGQYTTNVQILNNKIANWNMDGSSAQGIVFKDTKNCVIANNVFGTSTNNSYVFTFDTNLSSVGVNNCNIFGNDLNARTSNYFQLNAVGTNVQIHDNPGYTTNNYTGFFGFGTSTAVNGLGSNVRAIFQGAGSGNVYLGSWAGDSTYGAIGLGSSLSSGSYNFLSAPGQSLYINRPTNQSIYFMANHVEQAQISGAGKWGIGSTTPGAKLAVGGDVRADYFIGTSTTASSTFQILDMLGSATSTWKGGINLESGCFAVKGTCITAGGGSYTDAQARAAVAGLFAATTSSNTWLLSQTFNNLFATNASTTNATSTNIEITGQASSTNLTVSGSASVGRRFAVNTTTDLLTGNKYFGLQGSGQGTVLMGNWAGDSNYGMISLNGSASLNDYNFMSSGGDRNLYINSGSGKSIRFREGNTDRAAIQTGGNFGIGLTNPTTKLVVTGVVTGQSFTATSTTDTSLFWGNLISLGSTTLQNLNSGSSTIGTWLAGNGTTTNLAVTSLNAASCDVKAQTNGSLYCGTDATGAGGGVWPFVGSSNYSVNVQSTSTPLWFTGTAGVYASGTSYFNNLNIQYPSGTGVPFTIYANTSNVNTTMIENSGGDATLSVRSDAGYGAAWINLYSTAAEYQGITSYISDVLSWRIGNSGANSGLSIFVGSALNELVRFYNNMTVNINGRLGIASSTPWASFSLVSTTTEGILTPAMVIATSTDLSSVGFFAYWRPTAITPKWWYIHIGGATSSSRYDKDNITTFGQQNSDTLMVNVDPMTVALGASLTADSVVTSVGPGVVFDEITDGNLSVASVATSSVNITGGPTGVTNGCSDGGGWMNIRANELVGAVADEGGWVRGSMVANLGVNGGGAPAAAVGGILTASGTPTMEVTICTPTVTNAFGTSTTVMPAIYAFGFGDTAFGTTFAGSGVKGPANGAFLTASTTDNWWLVNTNANVGVKTDTGVATSTTRSGATTFRLSMTATATYAWKYDNNTGTWDSIGVQTTQQTKRNFTWFIGVQNPGTAGIRSDFLFRNLKVWYSPTYRF